MKVLFCADAGARRLRARVAGPGAARSRLRCAHLGFDLGLDEDDLAESAAGAGDGRTRASGDRLLLSEALRELPPLASTPAMIAVTLPRLPASIFAPPTISSWCRWCRPSSTRGCASSTGDSPPSPPTSGSRSAICHRSRRLRGASPRSPLELTHQEFELLKFLAQHRGKVFTREQLLSKVWGYRYFGGTRTVDIHVRRLRAKLGAPADGMIETVRNVGYKLVDLVSPGTMTSSAAQCVAPNEPSTTHGSRRRSGAGRRRSRRCRR